VAERVGCSPTTATEHLNRAETKLIKAMLNRSYIPSRLNYSGFRPMMIDTSHVSEGSDFHRVKSFH
jgi:hypothetical protein